MNMEKWDTIYAWLNEQGSHLSEYEKSYWLAQLAEQHEKMLEKWSERLELLDEIKEKLVTSAPYSFNKENENCEGISYFNLGLYEKTLEFFSAEAKEKLLSPRKNLYTGYAALYTGDGDKAKESFLNVLHQTSDPLEKHFSYLGLGLQEGQRQNTEQAVLYLEKAELLLFNPDVVYNLGICYLLMEMPDEALPYFKKTISAGDVDPDVFFWLGKCYLETGNHTEAMEVWYHAAEKFNSKELLLTLALEFEEMELFSGALYCYRKLEKQGCDPAVVYHGLAWNYGLLDEREEAKKFFRMLFEQDKRNSNGWISYLWLLISWADRQEIDSALTEIKAHNITDPLLSELSEKAAEI
nr:tetratricopeptide repeat protein [Evansella clarkii]